MERSFSSPELGNHQESPVAALIVSIIFSLIMAAGISRYAARRPENHQMSWGEASVFSTYVFMLLFIVFGIVPHQWLTVAENEWSFRADVLFDAWGLITPKSAGGWFPFDITLRAVSDSVAAIIYIVYLGAMTAMWKTWQEPKKSDSTEVVTSTYGRPLVKRG